MAFNLEEFGIVTVMNARIYDWDALGLSADGFTLTDFENKIAIQGEGLCGHIDSLKIANITMDGPSKTISGGQYANPLIKFGKSCTMEMQDALGRADMLQYLTGAKGSSSTGIHFTEIFPGAKTIVGDSFAINRKTGEQMKFKIYIYQFLPDALFNLTQDSEGDATVFDFNGSVLTTNLTIDTETSGVFYSIVPFSDSTSSVIFETNSVNVFGTGSIEVLFSTTQTVTSWTVSATNSSIATASIVTASKKITITGVKNGNTQVKLLNGTTVMGTVFVNVIGS